MTAKKENIRQSLSPSTVLRPAASAAAAKAAAATTGEFIARHREKKHRAT